MFKMITTLIRGQASEAEQSIADANALPLLRQQIRDASFSVKRSRHAVAVAIANQKQEEERAADIANRLKDLETRALAAIDAGDDAIATEAAQAIAELEMEKTACNQSLSRTHQEIERLKAEISKSQMRLRDIERGQRVAVATERAQKLSGISPAQNTSSLHDAEDTLKRLEQRQKNASLVAKAEQELEQVNCADNLTERMAKKGFGKPLETSADMVLQRLKSKPKTKKADT